MYVDTSATDRYGSPVRTAHRRTAVRVVAALAVVAGVSSLAAAVPAGAVTDRPNTFAEATRAAVSQSAVALYSTIDSRTDQDWFKFSVTATTKAAVTLGSLPGNYSLAVYDGAGRRVGLSAYPGVHFERVILSVGPGTYYVRVATQGDYSRTKRYMLRFRPLPPGVVVLDQYWIRQPGNNRAVATVFNNTPNWRWVPSLDVTWYDSNRRALRTDGGTMPQETQVIPPFGAMPFDSYSKRPPAGTASVSVTPNSHQIRPAAANPAVRVSGVSTRWSSRSGGYVLVEGTNSTSSNYFSGPVYVETYNANGTLTNVESYYHPRTVAAGRPEPFAITVYAPARPNAVRVYGLTGYGPPVLDLP